MVETRARLSNFRFPQHTAKAIESDRQDGREDCRLLKLRRVGKGRDETAQNGGGTAWGGASEEDADGEGKKDEMESHCFRGPVSPVRRHWPIERRNVSLALSAAPLNN